MAAWRWTEVMSGPALVGLAVGGLALGGCATGAADPYVSWGKAAVGYSDYRKDSIECGYGGATTDISGTKEYAEVRHGITTQNQALDNPDPTRSNEERARDYSLIYRRAIRPGVGDLQRFLVGKVAECLTARGYTPFILTPEQKAVLDTYRPGTPSRFHYLHSLGSDPAILAAQGLLEPADPQG